MIPPAATRISKPKCPAKMESELLWTHPSPQKTQMWAFLQHINKKFDLRLENWKQLYDWSCDDVDLFWKECWKYVGVVCEKEFDEVSDFM